MTCRASSNVHTRRDARGRRVAASSAPPGIPRSRTAHSARHHRRGEREFPLAERESHVEHVSHRRARRDDHEQQQPAPPMSVERRKVIAHHQRDHREREVVVVNRDALGARRDRRVRAASPAPTRRARAATGRSSTKTLPAMIVPSIAPTCRNAARPDRSCVRRDRDRDEARRSRPIAAIAGARGATTRCIDS